MAAEYDNLPEHAQREVRAFADVSAAWLERMPIVAGITAPLDAQARARAIYAAVAGARLTARGGADIARFDTLVTTHQASGLLPA